ncbi:MAG: carbon-nitrogen hydrolase family protein [Gaiellales bacterium]
MLVAVAQFEPKLGEIQRNISRIVASLEEASAAGARLIVFPECAVTGYVLNSPDEAMAVAQEMPGPTTEVLEEACARLDTYAVCGVLVRDGDTLRNRALLVGPHGLVGHYDKSHIPFLGVDRFVTAGSAPLVPFDTPIGRISIEICYDLRFPEVTRAHALAGAEIIAHPTNWPVAVRSNAEFMPCCRALENRVFVLTANRVGAERNAEFCGWSQIADITGSRLAEADATSDALLLADIDLAQAREKDLVPKPGEYEISLFRDRRPDLYGALAEEPIVVNQR